ncbi:hypothetical protein RD792_016493 [Penstemon davidsonii]|uniref:Alpha-1,3-mannosyl-glycoprotein 2-beta-N-acetylglucosaminyltransferase n=1 Tax=Penstemon davidsonii TaxID=160366 RepID=A0ABR0CJR0_9LAMI|nr:hypothetical protein RD792_016493 [Penstemon davidsonii]
MVSYSYSSLQLKDNSPFPYNSTAFLSGHYKWALDQLFYKHKFSRVIILEDDMEIAPDFFGYFEAGAALLDHDKSIMAISSWNDNGQRQFVHDPYVLYRSDFFPGLGWMLSRSTWDELSPKWPKAYPSRLKSYSTSSGCMKYTIYIYLPSDAIIRISLTTQLLTGMTGCD